MLILGIAIVALPVYITFVASTLAVDEVLQAPMPLIPGTHLVENYAKVLGQGASSNVTSAPVGRMMLNSLVTALVIAFGKITISLLSAFAIVYFRFRFRRLAFWMIFVTLMLPVEVRILPTYKVVSDLGHAGHLRRPDGAADRLGDGDVPVPPVLPDDSRRARRGGAHRRRRADALLLGRRRAAVATQHRRAVRDPVHLRLEPVPVAAARHHATSRCTRR